MSKNKFELDRSIPVGTKRKVRKEAGFGCVICGNIIVEYEHIDPEWNAAKKHDPNKMTLLCPTHHSQVTKGIMSKGKVWEAKKSPHAFKNKCIKLSDKFELNASQTGSIMLGSNYISGDGIALKVSGKPLIWFEIFEDNNQYNVNGIIYDPDGKCICYINRNEFIVNIGINRDEFDFESIKTSFIIKYKGKKIFHLNAEGGNHLKVEAIQMGYLKQLVSIADGCFEAGGLMMSGSSSVGNGECGVNCFKIPQDKTAKLLPIFMNASICDKLIIEKIISYNGDHVGYKIMTNKDIVLVNFANCCVGKIKKDNKVYSICDEFIGYYDNGFIGIDDNSYSTGEPIYNPHKTLSKIRKHKIDLSYRLFESK